MSDASQYRRDLVGETRRILQLLSEASDSDLATASACQGWSVLDVGRHVEITPRALAANISAHRAAAQSPAVAPLDPLATSAQVLDSLAAGAASLDAALEQLAENDLDGLLPGPVGPMPGRASLDLALTELTLHRCDIELGLGVTPAIDDEVAVRLISVVQAWLLLTAPSDRVPAQPWCLELRVSDHTWSFSYDGSRWGDAACRPGEAVDVESAGRALLVLAGREPSSPSDTSPLARLKQYLPGP